MKTRLETALILKYLCFAPRRCNTKIISGWLILGVLFLAGCKKNQVPSLIIPPLIPETSLYILTGGCRVQTSDQISRQAGSSYPSTGILTKQ